ncbi:hypothetical protein Bpfe_001491 [Biomphalaria pfeifferi]|uniref:Uncharacterized protein n=1 Tax=Biomphalaria pfeifferi TaxID=112525 RepID=A0AAD8CBL1_BIOPF|nr:hypothetical protein Bpfe_001491 [Biomphalaria pfeifferi]
MFPNQNTTSMFPNQYITCIFPNQCTTCMFPNQYTTGMFPNQYITCKTRKSVTCLDTLLVVLGSGVTVRGKETEIPGFSLDSSTPPGADFWSCENKFRLGERKRVTNVDVLAPPCSLAAWYAN